MPIIAICKSYNRNDTESTIETTYTDPKKQSSNFHILQCLDLSTEVSLPIGRTETAIAGEVTLVVVPDVFPTFHRFALRPAGMTQQAQSHQMLEWPESLSEAMPFWD